VKQVEFETIPLDSPEALALISDDGPEEIIDRRYITERLDEALTHLNMRQQFIIAMRHYGEKQMTLKELGEFYGIGSQRIRQIEQSALRKLRHPCFGLKHLLNHKFQEELAEMEEYARLKFTPEMAESQKRALRMNERRHNTAQEKRGIRERAERALKFRAAEDRIMKMLRA
jgi:hypothetical protein